MPQSALKLVAAIAVVFGFISIAIAQHSKVEQAPSLAIEHVSVIDVEHGTINKDQTVIIQNGLITMVRDSENSADQRFDKTIDGTGKYLIPGLWDMHIHWFAQPTMDLFPIRGVTGVRVMWGNSTHHRWREAFDAGEKLGPRMLIASQLVDGEKPYWPTSRVAMTEQDGAEVVDEAIEAKADFIKVYTLLPRAAYLSVAKNAKAKKIPFAGHVPRTVSAWEASELGQKSMEHLYEIRLACSSEEDTLRKMINDAVESSGDVVRTAMSKDGLLKEVNRRAAATFDEAKARKLFKTFKKNETWQCPTLTVLHNLAYIEEPVCQDNPDLMFIPPSLKSFLAPKKDPRGRSAEQLKQSQNELKVLFKIVRMMQEEEVPIIAGTDVLNPFCLPGFSLHDELRLMVDAGLTPAQALRTATINPAKYMNRLNELGSVAIGKQADLVLLDANPLEDISNTKKIVAVFLRGKLLDRKELNQRLQDYQK